MDIYIFANIRLVKAPLIKLIKFFIHNQLPKKPPTNCGFTVMVLARDGGWVSKNLTKYIKSTTIIND